MATITESGQEDVLKRLDGLGNIGFILAKLVQVSVLIRGIKRTGHLREPVIKRSVHVG
jgi:hypothetical protein